VDRGELRWSSGERGRRSKRASGEKACRGQDSRRIGERGFCQTARNAKLMSDVQPCGKKNWVRFAQGKSTAIASAEMALIRGLMEGGARRFETMGARRGVQLGGLRGNRTERW